MKNAITLLALLLSILSFSQELTGLELLEKSIQYHDPNNNWKTFKGTLWVNMVTPNSPIRSSEITIDLPSDYFYLKASKNKNTTEYSINKGLCKIEFNKKTNLSKKIKKEHNLSCKRANLYKNYYTYLYGLPMKLKDEGTIIHNKTARKKFKGKDYIVLKVTYKKEVGKDTWYFYFNPTTYSMEVYQFFKDTKDSGEYILLSEEELINGIKMPKNRAWYYNKNNKYLGTDVLEKSNSI
ncbi:DUF6503 family protein [Tenacibaculum halocynthiae]|uniref:DUF6503 family protein n=1 Tax=Tenacibaculum halocynthiae TaxID=1254437 RepID=UPI003D65E129